MTEKRKPGRPPRMDGGKRRSIYLDDESMELAERLGYGNASEGIRRALRACNR